MDENDAKVMSELVSYIDEKFAKYDEIIQHLLEKFTKQDETLSFLFGELNKKNDMLSEQGKKVRTIVQTNKELAQDINDLRAEVIDLEDKFFEVTIVDEVEHEIEIAEKIQSVPDTPKKPRKKQVLTKKMVMNIKYNKLRKIARTQLECTEYNKNTEWYRNYILEHETFIKGEVLI